MIQLVDDGYHLQAVRAGDSFIFKLKFLLYEHVMYILIGYRAYLCYTNAPHLIFVIKVHFITTTRPISILLDK